MRTCEYVMHPYRGMKLNIGTEPRAGNLNYRYPAVKLQERGWTDE